MLKRCGDDGSSVNGELAIKPVQPEQGQGDPVVPGADLTRPQGAVQHLRATRRRRAFEAYGDEAGLHQPATLHTGRGLLSHEATLGEVDAAHLVEVELDGIVPVEVEVLCVTDPEPKPPPPPFNTDQWCTFDVMCVLL